MDEPQVREVQEMQALRERELRLESQVSADLRRRLAAADDANTALEAELASAKAALEVEVARTREALLVKGGGGGGQAEEGQAKAREALEADKAAAVAECVRLAAALDAKGV